MKVLFLRSPGKIYEDSAYLLGMLTQHSEATHVQTIEADESKFVPDETTVDVIVDRSLQTNDKFFRSLNDVSRKMGVRVFNHPISTSLATDKRNDLKLYDGLLIPSYIVSSENEVEKLYNSLEGIVLKVPKGRMGDGVERLVEEYDPDLVERMLENADGQLVVQQYLSGLKDGDKRVLMLRDDNDEYEILGQYKRRPGNGQWKSNISLGGERLPAGLEVDEVTLVYKAARESGLDLVGLDVGRHGGKSYLIEANSYTGGFIELMNSSHQAGRAFIRRVEYLANKK